MKLYDADGIDGPFGRAISKALTENPAIIEARRCSKCGAPSRSPRDRKWVGRVPSCRYGCRAIAQEPTR